MKKELSSFVWTAWKFIAGCAAVVVIVWGVTSLWEIAESFYNDHFKEDYCYDPNCYRSVSIGPGIYYHENDGKGYVFNSMTSKKTIKRVSWIAEPNEDSEDSLVCFSNGKKRGYFNMYTGEVVIEPKYDHAWIFSDGLASVDENGRIKFIDNTGKVVIDRDDMTYVPGMDGYVFHGGYCLIGEYGHYGLLDKAGVMVLPQEYKTIDLCEKYDLWLVKKDEEMAVLDKNLNPVVPFMESDIYIDEGTIDATMPDHTMRKYDLSGKLIYDFYISSVRMLEYEKDEILYKREVTEDCDENGAPVQHVETEAYHPKATARLRAYVSDYHDGLITADGHIVTMPLYKDIEAIGHDLYLCTSTNCDKVVVNGKGEIVR